MWRTESVHARGESEWLEEALERVIFNKALRNRAEATLRAVANEEPLLSAALRTPQSPPSHCEGPFLLHHLRIQLQVLYAILDESLHLIDIEEFRRLTGYAGEIDELEETIKEQAAFFETFVLCHDVPKWVSVMFTAEPGSRGHALGFAMEAKMIREDIGASERAKWRERYAALYEDFVRDHGHENEVHAELAFFDAYGILVHYPGHDRLIHAPVHRSLLERVAFGRRLPHGDALQLEDVIAWHLEPLMDFVEPRPERMAHYVRFSHEQGYDADDFLDRLQAAVFLDGVASSARMSLHGAWHDVTPLVNFLKSEHDYAPQRRIEKEAAREEERRRARNRLFREVGLDGVALLELTGMEPGPRFGKFLKAVQEAAMGGMLPKLKGAQANREIERRVALFRQRAETVARNNRAA